MNTEKWTTAHLFVYSADVVSVFLYVIVSVRVPFRESDDGRFLFTLLHTFLQSVADISGVVAVDPATGCDQNACKHK